MKIGGYSIPQGLKPPRFCGLFGTTESRALLQSGFSTSFQQAVKLCPSKLFHGELGVPGEFSRQNGVPPETMKMQRQSDMERCSARKYANATADPSTSVGMTLCGELMLMIWHGFLRQVLHSAEERFRAG